MTQRSQTPENISLINGLVCDKVSIADRGFAYGDGLFETILFEQNSLPLLSYHLDRLFRGLSLVNISLDKDQVTSQLSQFLDLLRSYAIARAKIKIVVTRGSLGEGSYPVTHGSPTVVITAQSLPNDWINSGVSLVVSPVSLPAFSPLAGIKSTSRAFYIAAAQQIERQSDQEILLLDVDEHVVETMHHNIFMVHGQTLFTPAIKTCGVRGVMRECVIRELANRIGFSVKEVDISVAELQKSNEVFISNAVKGFTSVSGVDNQTLGSVGVCEKLNAEWKIYKSEL
ncbi:MAG: aminodeoxychorismate lyase [Agarilytica sp.]